MFLVGHATVAAVLLACYFIRHRLALWALIAVFLFGLAGISLSATPLPTWAYVLWSVVGTGALMLSFVTFRGRGFTRLRIATVAATILASAAMCAAEMRYRLLPQITVRWGQTVYVIGDSISAGIGAGAQTWPAVLAEEGGLKVVNLAMPGATVASALNQADGVAEHDALVILEIGGNDLLGSTSPDAFRTHLDQLLAKTAARSGQMVMLELPLPPYRMAYGAAQRGLARKHGVTLIPKRVLASVLGMKKGTIDGLHLTQAGHDALARRVLGMLLVE
jgi:acyl-CoA thioesterase-1